MSEPWNATIDADYQPIEARRHRVEVHDTRIYDTGQASCQWRIEPRNNTVEHFTGRALFLGVHGAWFVHEYHQWERFNTLTPLTRRQAILLTEQYAPRKVLDIFAPLLQAGERVRPPRKKKKA